MTNQTQILPSAVDLEEGVLGAILLDVKAFMEVSGMLCVAAFSNPKHALVYSAILDLDREGKPIEILTVTHQLRKEKKLEEVGGAVFVSKLTNKIASTANLPTHAYLLNLKYQLREIIRISEDAKEKGYMEEDPKDIISFIESEISALTDTGAKKESKLSALLPQIYENAAKRKQGISATMSTGFKALDGLIRGWNKANYIMIGAKSSMGKTAFMCSSVVKAARMGIPQAIFELEMTELELMYRIVSQETGILYEAIANGEMTVQEEYIFKQKYEEIAALPIYIDDTPGISIFDFNTKCRALAQKYGEITIWVDYIQLMTLGQGLSKKMIGNREQEVSFISKMVKRTAKQINLPIIALSQLNNEDSKRAQANKRPILTDLRESSALQHDPDIVAFIHRPERTGETEDESGNSTKGIAEIIIAKNRNGRLDIVKLKYTAHLMQFDDIVTDAQYILDNFGHPDTFHDPSTDKPF